MAHWTEAMFLEQAEQYAADLEAAAEVAPDQVADLLALLDDEHGLDPDDALDVACGVGRHAVALAERGVEATGIDLSPTFVERARERAREAGLDDQTEFAVHDMRALDDLAGTYDLVTSLYTSFGYYDDETNREILAGMADRVADDGALVLEVNNREAVLADFRESAVYEDEHAPYVYTEQREYAPETARMETRRRMFEVESGADEDAEREDLEHLATFGYDLRLYTPVELHRLAREVGFSAASLYADYEGGALERESDRLLLVAEH